MAYLRCTGTPGGSLKLRTAQGEIASFETNMADVLQEVKCELAPSLTGYTAVNLTACGVNLFDIPTWLDSISTPYTVDNGVYTFQTSIRLNTPFVLSDTDKPFTVSVNSFGGTAVGQRVQLLNSSDAVVATADKDHLTVTATASKVRLDYGLGGSYILDNCIVYDNATGNTYTIQFEV